MTVESDAPGQTDDPRSRRLCEGTGRRVASVRYGQDAGYYVSCTRCGAWLRAVFGTSEWVPSHGGYAARVPTHLAKEGGS